MFHGRLFYGCLIPGGGLFHGNLAGWGGADSCFRRCQLPLVHHSASLAPPHTPCSQAPVALFPMLRRGRAGGVVTLFWAGAPTPGAVRVPSSVTVRGATALLLLLDHIHEGVLWVDL